MRETQRTERRFTIGQRVRCAAGEGFVTAVWDGVGMLDVQIGDHLKRVAVETARLVPRVNVPNAADRVARAFLKKSLYWHGRDRKYRVNREEHSTGQYRCPARDCEGVLRKGIYMMENGQRVRLYVCPDCIFMIRAEDILADHCVPPEEEVC